MLRSGAEIASVELVCGTDLGKGWGRRMERDRDGRREFERGHEVRTGGGVEWRERVSATEGGVRPGEEARNTLSEQAMRAMAAQARRKTSG
jgi:hypothetical protein